MNCKPTFLCDPVVLDRAAMLDRVGGDESLLREIAGIFLDDYPSLLREMRVAIDSGDAKGLERAAHSLKGAVANFGAHAATQAAFHLEHLGRQNRFDGVPDAVERLEEQLSLLHPALLELADS